MTTNMQAALASLAHDGDTYKDDNGRTFRLSIDPDEYISVNDFDCYGKIAPVTFDRWSGRDLPRPRGFTGRARKIQVDRGDWVWWEPSEDVPTDKIADEARGITRLLQEGFYVVTLTVLAPCVCHRGACRDCEVARVSLGGIDSLENGYLADVVDDLLSEVAAQLED